ILGLRRVRRQRRPDPDVGRHRTATPRLGREPARVVGVTRTGALPVRASGLVATGGLLVHRLTPRPSTDTRLWRRPPPTWPWPRRGRDRGRPPAAAGRTAGDRSSRRCRWWTARSAPPWTRAAPRAEPRTRTSRS